MLKVGETRVTKLPDSMDGIRFTVGRMVKMIEEGRKDPLVIETARKIAALATSGRKLKGGGRERDLWVLKAIHAWCRANFEFVKDPVGVELLQTPNRMLMQLAIPPLLHKAMWEPIGKVLGGKMPAPKMNGDADEATTLSLALAAAVGIAPLKIMLGGAEGAVYTCWGAAYAGGAKKSEPAQMWDMDILHDKFGSHQAAEQLEDVDVTL